MILAQSVTGDLRLQSYVASSHPDWLNCVFVEDMVL